MNEVTYDEASVMCEAESGLRQTQRYLYLTPHAARPVHRAPSGSSNIIAGIIQASR